MNIHNGKGKKRANQHGYTRSNDSKDGRTVWKPVVKPASQMSRTMNDIKSDTVYNDINHIAERIVAQYEPNDAFPFPQANDVDKLLSVVDAIDKGVDTGEGINIVMDSNSSDGRVGAYYGDAAGYLNLVDKEDGVYRITPLGKEISSMHPDDQIKVFSALINNMEEVDYYRDEGQKELVKYIMNEHNMSETTATRRASCIAAWVDKLDSEDFSDVVNENRALFNVNLLEAQEHTKQQRIDRARSKESEKPKARHKSCPHCGMSNPAHLQDCEYCGEEI